MENTEYKIKLNVAPCKSEMCSTMKFTYLTKQGFLLIREILHKQLEQGHPSSWVYLEIYARLSRADL